MHNIASTFKLKNKLINRAKKIGRNHKNYVFLVLLATILERVHANFENEEETSIASEETNKETSFAISEQIKNEISSIVRNIDQDFNVVKEIENIASTNPIIDQGIIQELNIDKDALVAMFNEGIEYVSQEQLLQLVELETGVMTDAINGDALTEVADIRGDTETGILSTPLMIALGVLGIGGAATGVVLALNENDHSAEKNNESPTAIALSAATVAENALGAVIGTLTTTDVDATDTHSYAIDDVRFEVVSGELKLKDTESLDFETEATVDVTVTATDSGGLTFSQLFTVTVTDVAEITSLTGTSSADTFNFPTSLDEFIINTLAGDDSITTSAGSDVVRAGEGADTVNTGDGNDIIVIVGQTAANQYVQSDITNPGGSGIDLSNILTLDTLNGRAVSEVVAGENIDGGAGTNRLIIYGNVDFTGVTLTNVTQFQVNSTVTIDAQKLNSLPMTVMVGDGDSVLNLISVDGSAVTVDLSSIQLVDFRTLNLEDNVTLIADQADVDSLKYITGTGVIKASTATGNLDLSGKQISVAVQDKDGVDDATHGAVVTSGNIVIGSEAADTLLGTALDDRLEGGLGDDVLTGGEGNDVLRGGAGVDTMDGGAGDDIFVVVGDLSSGGKVDSDEDTFALAQPLTELNGLNLNEDADGAKEIIRGGDGNDTLYVYGTADLSQYDITGIEHIEIRSDVTFDSTLKFKTLTGDGSSTIHFSGGTASNPSIIDMTGVDAATLGQIGRIDLGEHVILKIDSLEQLGGAKILTGKGKIEATTDITLSESYSVTNDITITNPNGDAKGNAETLSAIITPDSSTGTDIVGTDGNDYLEGSYFNDAFDPKNGNDVLNGLAGNDTFKINGTGKKTILDSEGVDTLDLSLASEGAVVDLTDGGTIGSSTTIQLGAGSQQGVAQQGGGDANVMLIVDVSGSMSGQRLTDAKKAAIELLDAYDSKGNVTVRMVKFTSSATSSFNGVDEWMDIDSAKAIINGLSAGGGTRYTSAVSVGEQAFNSGKDGGFFNNGTNVSYFLSDGAGGSIAQADWEDFLIQNDITSHAVGFGGISTTTGLEPIAFDGTKVSLPTDDHAAGEIPAVIEVDTTNLGSTLVTTAKLDFIENLIGTSFADTLIGNDLDNEIKGGDGNDELLGLGGDDTLKGGLGAKDVAVYSGVFDDYEITVSDSKTDLIVKGVKENGLLDGTDIVSNTVEILRFADRTEVKTSGFFPKFEGITNPFPIQLMADFSYAAYRNDTDKLDTYDSLVGDGWVFIGKDTLGFSASGITMPEEIKVTSQLKKIDGHAITQGANYDFGETIITGKQFSFIDAPTGDTFPVYTQRVYYENGGVWLDSNGDNKDNIEQGDGYEIHGSASAIVAVKGDSLVISFRGTEDVTLPLSGTDASLPIVRALMQIILSKNDQLPLKNGIPNFSDAEFKQAAQDAIKFVDNISYGLGTPIAFGAASALLSPVGGIGALIALKKAGDLSESFLINAAKTPSEKLNSTDEAGIDYIPDTDSAGWLNQAGHYEKFSPLIESLKDYVLDGSNGIKKVYVTGHSLGAGMASWFLTDDKDGGAFLQNNGIDVFGASFAAPGIATTSATEKKLADGTKYFRFEVAKDIVPDTGDITNKTAKHIPSVHVFNPGVQANAITTNDDWGRSEYKNTITLHGMNNYNDVVALLDQTGLLKDMDFLTQYTHVFQETTEESYDPLIMTVLNDFSVLGDVRGGGGPNGETSTGDLGAYGREMLGYAERYTKNDVIIGTKGNDILIGDGWGSRNGTDDIFYIGLGKDTVYGHEKVDDNGGTDTVVYNFDSVNISSGKISGDYTHETDAFFDDKKTPGGKNKVLVNLDGSEDTLYDIEQFHFVSKASSSSDLLVGNDKINNLNAGLGDDYLYGGGGGDILTGGGGNDRLHGGSGNDTAIFNGVGPYQYTIENWSVKVQGGSGTDYLYDIENLEVNGVKSDISTALGLSDSELLKMYAPVLGLEQDDYIPTSIEAFLDHAILFESGALEKNDPIAFGKNIGSLGEKVYELDLWPNPDDEYMVKTSLSDPDSIKSILDSGKSYYLDFINGEFSGREDTDPGSIADAGDWANKSKDLFEFDAKAIDDEYGSTVYAQSEHVGGSIYLQYYFFYVENDWTDYVSVGGYHEADWEFMQIELDKDTLLPNAFSTSTHIGYGQVRNPFDHDISHANNHVLTYVADGGHGNYLTKGKTSFAEYLGGTDERFDDKLLVPDVEDKNINIQDGLGNTWGASTERDNYDLVEITPDSFVGKWLELDVVWGKDYKVGSPISNPPKSPVYNKDDRWDSPESWIKNNLYEASDIVENLRDSDNYQLDADGSIQLAGLSGGQMEMGFLFDDTELAPLGHFDLV